MSRKDAPSTLRTATGNRGKPARSTRGKGKGAAEAHGGGMSESVGQVILRAMEGIDAEWLDVIEPIFADFKRLWPFKCHECGEPAFLLRTDQPPASSHSCERHVQGSSAWRFVVTEPVTRLNAMLARARKAVGKGAGK